MAVTTSSNQLDPTMTLFNTSFALNNGNIRFQKLNIYSTHLSPWSQQETKPVRGNREVDLILLFEYRFY